MPTLCKLYDEFHEKGLVVIGVSIGDKLGKLKSFVKMRNVPYTVLHDPDNMCKRLFYLQGIPQTILIDKKGVVVRIWRGWSGEPQEQELRAELAKLGIRLDSTSNHQTERNGD